MRMLSKALLVVVVLSMGLADLSAREGDWSVTFSYNMATPTGRTAEYVDRYSWSGFGGEASYWFDDHNTVGLTSGWQRFNAFYRDALANFDGGAVYGSQVRYVTAVPLLLTATHYMADPIDKIKPFVKLGAGVYWMTPVLEIGLYRFQDTRVHFGLMPSVGLDFKLDRKSSMVVQLDYNAALSSGETILGEPSNEQSYIGIKVGFRFDN